MIVRFLGGPLDGREREAEHWSDVLPAEVFHDAGWLLLDEVSRLRDALPWVPARRLSLAHGCYELTPSPEGDGADLFYRWVEWVSR